MNGSNREERPELESDDSPGGTVQQHHDWSTTDPSTAVVETLAAATGVDEIAIAPLYGAVDPDALDALVAGHQTGTPDDRVEVTFVHDGYHVVVASDGRVNVRPVDQAI